MSETKKVKMTHNAIFAVLSTNWLHNTVRRWVLVPCLLIPVVSFSQDHTREIDSLRMLLNSLPKDAFNERGRLYVELGGRHNGADALRYYDLALSILDDSVQIVRAIQRKGVVLFMSNRHREARTVLESILPYARTFQPYHEATELNRYFEGVYGLLSGLYVFDGEYRLAIVAANHTLELSTLFPTSTDLSRGYNHLGLIYYKLRDNERAVAMYRKALHVQLSQFGNEGIRLRHSRNRSKMLLNIALCYSEMDSLAKALIYLDSAQNSSLPRGIQIHMNFGYGMVFTKQAKYAEAETSFQMALKDARDIWDVRMIAECLVYSARVFLETARYTDAQKAIYEAEKLASENNFNEILLDTYRQALVLFSEAGDHARLADYQNKYIRHKQHIHNADVASELVLAELRLAEAAHNQELAVQEKKLATQETLKRYQRWLSSTSVGITLLMFLFILSLIYRVNARRRIETALSTKVNERKRNLIKNEHRTKQISLGLSIQQEVLTSQVEKVLLHSRLQFSEHASKFE